MKNDRAVAEAVQGKWIKLSNDNYNQSYFCFARGYFDLDENEILQPTCVHLAVSHSYKLLVNHKTIGAGPIFQHQSTCSDIETFDISVDLKKGRNEIVLILYFSNDTAKDFIKNTPGFYCIVNNNNQPKLLSNESWEILKTNALDNSKIGEAARCGMTEHIIAQNYPMEIYTSELSQCTGWVKANDFLLYHQIPYQLRNSTFSMPTVDEYFEFESSEVGGTEEIDFISFVSFESIYQPGVCVYCGSSFIFSENNQSIQLKLQCSDKFKLLCNSTIAASGAYSNGQKIIELKLKSGWNRLLILLQPSRANSGCSFIFPKNKISDFRLYQDMVEDANDSWNIAGPLKLSLSSANAALQIDHLNLYDFYLAMENIPNIDVYLRNLRFIPSPVPIDSLPELSEGEYIKYQLSQLRYGFVKIEFEAEQNDIVDITIGQQLSGNNFPLHGNYEQNTHTVVCRKGLNIFSNFAPEDCFYCQIFVRTALGHVKLIHVGFEELKKKNIHDVFFNCSDDALNYIWEVGRNITDRSSARVQLPEPRIAQGCFMLDAYAEALNMIAVHGNFEYSKQMLRSFSENQVETGEILPLSCGSNYISQLPHLFIYPLWLLEHYYYSNDQKFVIEMLPHLESLLEFFKGLLKSDTHLLADLWRNFDLPAVTMPPLVMKKGYSTTLNSMFCRFLLSCSELYRICEQPVSANYCLELMVKTAEALTKVNGNQQTFLFCENKYINTAHYDIYANIIALLSGVAPVSSFEYIFEKYFSEHNISQYRRQFEDPYFVFIFLKMMFAFKYTNWSIEFLKEWFIPRSNPAVLGWMSKKKWQQVATNRLAYGDTISPNIFLVEEVVGIRSAEPGFEVIYFTPAFESISSAELTTATYNGKFKIKWSVNDNNGLDVFIDASYPVKIFPDIDPEVLSNCRFDLNENVTILQHI